MKLLVGLGNPGPKHEVDRHNIGFLMLDMLTDDAGISWGGEKFKGLIAKGSMFGESCVFLKPQQFMNVSGPPVQAAMKFFKIPPEDLIVFHDDIDLGSGQTKVKNGGGHGGHNGLRSIAQSIGTKDFARIRLGVGRPENKKMVVADWVLASMTDRELETLEYDMLPTVKTQLKEELFGV